jgi:hypothetical protein
MMARLLLSRKNLRRSRCDLGERCLANLVSRATPPELDPAKIVLHCLILDISVSLLWS